MLDEILEIVCVMSGGMSLTLVFIDVLCFAADIDFPSYSRMKAAAAAALIAAIVTCLIILC